MTNGHVSFTSDYLSSTQAVLQSGKLLRTLKDADPATRDYAVTQLERAAQRHQNKGTDFRSFMFSETTNELADTNIKERATEDVLATIMTDLNIASMLMASGQSVGELGPQKDVQFLDETLLAVDNSARIVEGSLPGPMDRTVPGRFGFSEPAPAKPSPSVDLPAAIENFKTSSEASLKGLIDGAKDAVMTIITALTKLDANKVMEALGQIGGAIDLPKVGRLFRQGVDLLKSVLENLKNWLGKELVGKVQEQVEKIWDNLKQGQYVSTAIEWAFGVDTAREEIARVLESSALKQSALDDGSLALNQLSVAFKENMGLLQGIAGAVTLAGAVLFLVPGMGPQLTLAAAAIYVLILGTIVLIGRDYTDSGPFERVRGVRQIARDCI